MFLRKSSDFFGCNLSRKWSALPGSFEANGARSRTTEYIALPIRYGNDRVVERRPYVRHCVRNYCLDFFAGLLHLLFRKRLATS